MRNFIKILVVVISAAFISLASAQQQLPPPGDPKPFQLSDPTNFDLENGLRATFVEFGIVPKVTIRVVVKAGNLNEGDQTWLADVTAEMMKEGTQSKSALELVVAAADMGGGITIGVGVDQMLLETDVLSENAPEALALLADILRNPLMPEAELARIKANFLRNLSISKTQPGGLAQEAFLGLLFGDHPYGVVFPEDGKLESYSLEDVTGFYAQNIGAARVHVYVVGQFDAPAMRRAIDRAFADWAPGPAAFELPASPQTGLRVKLIDRPGSEQSTIFLGLSTSHVGDADYIPFQVMHTLLGGSFSSRITQNIREDKGYTYSPRASISHRKNQAYWYERADINTPQTALALAEIFYEIRNLQENLPTPDEVNRVQNYRAGIFVLQNGSRSGIINQLTFLNLQGLGAAYLNTYVENVFEVTGEAISEMAATQLPLDQMTLVVVGDLSLIEEQIRALPELQGAEYVE